jgi:hypothetical protein
MKTADLILLSANVLLLLATLAGLFVRGRLRLSYFFPAYLLTVVVLSSLVGLWPERFHTWGFYWAKESAYSLLKIGIALELTVKVFQAYPAARRAARGAFLAVLAVTVVAAWSVSIEPPAAQHGQQAWAELVFSLHPRITNGTAWLFGALFGLILYYRLPLDPLHKAIAFGFMAYLLFFTFGLDQVKRSDFARLTLVSYASAVGYTLVAAYWARAAWRKGPAPPAPPDVVRRLQPWREEPPPDM